MFTNKSNNGLNNICGAVIKRRRKELRRSQRQLADMLQLAGLDVDKNAIQRIEAGKRFVTDVEITYLAKVLGLSYEEMLDI